jgi:hypothetical protein
MKTKVKSIPLNKGKSIPQKKRWFKNPKYFVPIIAVILTGFFGWINNWFIKKEKANSNKTLVSINA